jgi:hypothetical protein
LAIAEAHKDLVSDIVLLNASRRLEIPLGVRAHFISSVWSLLFAMTALPQVLRNIRIELIERPVPSNQKVVITTRRFRYTPNLPDY